MKTYYFTFGQSGQPYKGGWVEIKANSCAEAQQKFIDHFGAKAYSRPGILNYAWHYPEEYFKDPLIGGDMYEKGNFGAFCHEVIE
ncbi:MAG TPA: hypothetical protein GXX46_02050 [Peptococcaceae bacterium]|nr:hypothetical protein [Peptococcaceae bacterium]